MRSTVLPSWRSGSARLPSSRPTSNIVGWHSFNREAHQRLGNSPRVDTEVALEPFEAQHTGLLIDWLRRPHVARWFGDLDSHAEWSRNPPSGGSQSIIAMAGQPMGYLRWQRVSRMTLDTVGLMDIPENSVDVDLFPR